MIHYQLRCSQSHAFDGWFPGSAAFEQQSARGLLECPVCGDTNVERGLMAPALPRRGNAIMVTPEASPEPAAPERRNLAVGGDRLPDGVRAVLQRLRAEVEKRCDYVGDDFAGEARRIHNGEANVRGIYGEATPEQAEELADDGIAVARIPWVPRADG
jgi:hypothetical protein